MILSAQRLLTITLEMEMRKLHMGTMSYGFDSMDEVAHQLASAFGVDHGAYSHLLLHPGGLMSWECSSCKK